MKAILFSDLHLGLANDAPHFHDMSLKFAEWMSKEASSRGITTLICGGDVFHNRKSINLLTLDAASKFFDILKDFDIRIITGNHDCLYLENSDVHSISLLKKWPNISVYDTPYYEIFDGTTVGFIPWGISPEKMQKCDIMIGHYEITGFQMGPKAFCEHGMTPAALLKKSPMIFSGHFHKPQLNKYNNGEIVYMGACFQHNWGDVGQDRYIYELDLKTKTYDKIINNISPKHIEITKQEDVKLAKGNIVRVITDSPTSDLLKSVSDIAPITLSSIIESKELLKSNETIKDFKATDPIEAAQEVANKIEGLSKDHNVKVIKKMKDILSKVS